LFDIANFDMANSSIPLSSLYVTSEVASAQPIRYISLRAMLPHTNYELWEALMRLRLLMDLLWQNGYPLQTETAVAVNYKSFSNYHYDFDLEKIEKCGTFQSCDDAIYKITHCGKCYKLFELTFDDEYVPHEKYAHYPGKDIPSSGGTSVWTCCGRSHNEPGCVTNNAHVWSGVVRGVNEFLRVEGLC